MDDPPAASSLVNRAERMSDQRPEVTAVVEVSANKGSFGYLQTSRRDGDAVTRTQRLGVICPNQPIRDVTQE